jgi:hypothetical protein
MQVYIHPHITGNVRKEIEDLLKEIGCEIVDDVDDVELDPADDPVDDDVDCDEYGHHEVPACIVVLTPGLTEDDLQPAMTQAVAHGCRIIGIWAPNADGDMSALKDYGADTVPWNSELIRDAIYSKPQHQAPDGTATRCPKPTTGGC